MVDKPSPDEGRPKRLPILPLRDVVVYPHMVIPLFVGREKSVVALDQAMSEGKEILLVAQTQADVDDPGKEVVRQGQREVAVGDRRPERPVLGPFRVNMDPLVIARRVRELVDALLVYPYPVAVTQVFAHRIDYRGRTFENFRHYPILPHV